MKARYIRDKLFRKREVTITFIMLFNSFSWYFPLYIFFVNVLDSIPIEHNILLFIHFSHYAAIVVFAFAGNFLSCKLKRYNLILLWVFIGILSSLSMLPAKNGEIEWVFLASTSLGISLGLGFPSCLAYFADNIAIDRRGFIGGFTFFLTFIGMFAVGFLNTMLDHLTNVLFFTLWRSTGLILLLLFRPERDQQVEIEDVSYWMILHERAFILYLIPWLMFSLINFVEIPVFDVPLQQNLLGTDIRYLISIGEFGIGGVSALVGGLLSDIIGRKRIIVSAYLMVGIGYAVLSFAFSNFIILYFYILLDGIAWGIFALMFYLIIWGDLALARSKEKYYLIGTLPFLISSFVPFFVTPYAGAIHPSMAFSLASFFLFLAVVPLMYAPETLPEKKLRERELRSYIEKAKKVKEKYG